MHILNVADGRPILPTLAPVYRAARAAGFEDTNSGHHGHTALLDNGQAAVLDVKLPWLPEWIRHQRHIAEQCRSGVETLVHSPKPLWEHWALGLGDPDLPNTPRICREVLSLPMSTKTSDAQVDSVIEALRRFFGTR